MKEMEAKISKGFKLQDGPFSKALDSALQEFKVARQAYYGGTFVGNHVHKCLQVKHNHLHPVLSHLLYSRRLRQPHYKPARGA